MLNVRTATCHPREPNNPESFGSSRKYVPTNIVGTSQSALSIFSSRIISHDEKSMLLDLQSGNVHSTMKYVNISINIDSRIQHRIPVR